jgi:hypothetical protein
MVCTQVCGSRIRGVAPATFIVKLITFFKSRVSGGNVITNLGQNFGFCCRSYAPLGMIHCISINVAGATPLI